METKEGWKEVGVNLRTHVYWAISSFIDALFVSFWIAVTWIVNEYVIEYLELSGIDRWQLQVFQIIFAISTVIPIICYVLKDVLIMIMKLWKELHKEYTATSITVTQQARNVIPTVVASSNISLVKDSSTATSVEVKEKETNK